MDAWSPILSFALAALATWRVTHLLAEEDGPFDSMLKLRAGLGTSTAGKLMDCFQCLSLWIAAPFTFVMTHSIGMWVLVWLALSGAACLLERVGHDPAELQFRAPDFPENNDHDVLRSRANDPEGHPKCDAEITGRTADRHGPL